MKSWKPNGIWTVAAMMAVLVAGPANAQTAGAQTATATSEREIVVSLMDHKLALVEDGRVIHIYSVAVGKPSTPSPVGTFTILHRVADPTYYHHGKVIPPGPGNPVGDRWMSLSIPGYGIHGTNEPGSIGKAASHGCIRLGRRDVEDLFRRVRVGDKVVFVAERDEETAQIFGDGLAQPTTARQPVQVASADGLQPVELDAPAAAPVADNRSLMAKNTPTPPAGISAAGSW
jgi:lipoprotein-anchoring transpeptidase ErfK/SrfK